MTAPGHSGGRARDTVRLAMPLFTHAMRHDLAAGLAKAAPGRISTGLTSVDHVLAGGLDPGVVTIVGGRLRAGVSSFLLGMTLAALERGEPVAYLSERVSERQLRGRLVLLAARVNGYRLRAGLMSPEDRIALATARERIRWQSLSLAVKRELSPFDVDDHLYTYRPHLLIADLIPRPPEPPASGDRLASLAAGALHLAQLAAEHRVALALRVVLPRGAGAPSRADLPGRGALADAAGTVLLLHRRELDAAPAYDEPTPAHEPASAELMVIRHGSRDLAPAHVPLRFDQRFAGLGDLSTP